MIRDNPGTKRKKVKVEPCIRGVIVSGIASGRETEVSFVVTAYTAKVANGVHEHVTPGSRREP